jgi:hypothetical protein
MVMIYLRLPQYFIVDNIDLTQPIAFVLTELKPVKLEITPAYGDPNGSHVTIKVVSDAFEGKRSLQRQQMVYKVRTLPNTHPLVFTHVPPSLQFGHLLQR